MSRIDVVGRIVAPNKKPGVKKFGFGVKCIFPERLFDAGFSS
jgi:hypothetical protein